MARPTKLDRSSFDRLKLDRFGIGLSALCTVHCIGSILLVGALGLGGQWLLSPAIHEVGLAIAVVIGAITIGAGIWRHGRLAPLAIGSGGVMLMAAALWAPHGLGEALFTVAGVTLVAIAHTINLRFHMQGPRRCA